MPVPVQDLATTDDYVRILDAPTVFPAGERFAYNNAGYVVLAALAEAATGETHDLVADLVCRPAGIRDTAFLRSDELPGRVAQGYLRPRAQGPTSSTCPSAGTGMVDSTPRSRTSMRSGRRSSPDASCARRRSRAW